MVTAASPRDDANYVHMRMLSLTSGQPALHLRTQGDGVPVMRMLVAAFEGSGVALGLLWLIGRLGQPGDTLATSVVLAGIAVGLVIGWATNTYYTDVTCADLLPVLVDACEGAEVSHDELHRASGVRVSGPAIGAINRAVHATVEHERARRTDPHGPETGALALRAQDATRQLAELTGPPR